MKQKFQNSQILRDYCYKEAIKDKELSNCNASQGWCEPCLWQEDWTSYD